MSKQALDYIYGIHTCEALTQRNPERIINAYCLDSRQDATLQNLIDQLTQLNINVVSKDRDALEKLAQSPQHQGIVLQCKTAQAQDNRALKNLVQNKLQHSHDILLLILDGVTDPHNLGACIRSAEAAGADALIIPKNRAAGLSPTARKVACGAAEILPIFSVTNIAQCIKDLKAAGIWLYGAAGEASNNIYTMDLRGNIALIMGSEGSGIRHLTRELCDGLVHIPMHGATNSLNVSVATGVCLFEAQRQRQTSS